MFTKHAFAGNDPDISIETGGYSIFGHLVQINGIWVDKLVIHNADGSLGSRGLLGDAYFEYGTTSTPGSDWKTTTPENQYWGAMQFYLGKNCVDLPIPDTTYYYRAAVKVNNEVYYGDAKTFTTRDYPCTPGDDDEHTNGQVGKNSGSSSGISINAGYENPLSSSIDTIPKFIKAVLDIILIIGISIVTLAIIYTGFLFIKAQGKAEEISKAKKSLLYVIIGAALLLGAWVLSEAISETINEIRI